MAYSFQTRLIALMALLLATTANALPVLYCSSQNTAGESQAQYSPYMSNGLCQNDCIGYAYGILQGSNCWCSNYAPADQVNSNQCDEVCPGYPADWCGSSVNGLYGYYALGPAPSGTAGAAAPSPPSSSVSFASGFPGFFSQFSSFFSSSLPASSSSSSITSSTTLAAQISSTATLTSATSSSSIYIAPSTTSTHSQDPTTSVQPSTSTPPSTTAQPTQVYTSIMTVTGQVKTVIVTPTASADPSPLGQGVTSHGGVSTGKVVGIVLGVALGLGLLIGLAVWFWLRRKHQSQSRETSRNDGYAAEDSGASHTTPSRQISQMSSSGLLGKGPRLMTASYGPSNTNPRSPDTVSSNGIDRRSLGTDQRLNPYAIFAHEEARLSSVSLQDNQDYSRQLRIANPD